MLYFAPEELPLSPMNQRTAILAQDRLSFKYARNSGSGLEWECVFKSEIACPGAPPARLILSTALFGPRRTAADTFFCKIETLLTTSARGGRVDGPTYEAGRNFHFRIAQLTPRATSPSRWAQC